MELSTVNAETGFGGHRLLDERVRTPRGYGGTLDLESPTSFDPQGESAKLAQENAWSEA